MFFPLVASEFSGVLWEKISINKKNSRVFCLEESGSLHIDSNFFTDQESGVSMPDFSRSRGASDQRPNETAFGTVTGKNR